MTRTFHNIWLFTNSQTGVETIEAIKYDYRPQLENAHQRIIWQGMASSPENAMEKANNLRGSWSRDFKRVSRVKAEG